MKMFHHRRPVLSRDGFKTSPRLPIFFANFFNPRLAVAMMLCAAAHFSAQAAVQYGSKNIGAVLFLGDSITQGGSDNDGTRTVRSCLYQLLTAGGYTFNYTGHSTANPEGLPTTGSTASSNIYQYHSGVAGSVIGANVMSGGTVSRYGLTQSLPIWWGSGRLAVMKPNLILLMIGTNDVDTNLDLANAPKRLTTLLNTIYAQPNVGNPTILVATIPPNRTANTKPAAVANYNAALPAVVKSFQDANRDVYLVDQFTDLNNNFGAVMIGTGNLHPNGNGDFCIARNWFTAIQELTQPQLSLAPLADAYVRDGSYANANFGAANALISKADSSGYRRQIFLKFSTSGVGSNYAQATLWLYGGRDASGTLVSTVENVQGTTSENWIENTLTWNNKPALGSVINSATISSQKANWISWDVSSFVASKLQSGAGTITLAVTMNQPPAASGSYDTFASKEASANRPQLVLAPGTQSSTIRSAIADAYVRDGSFAGKNFGSDTALLSKTCNYSGYSRKIYLKFDLSNAPANASQIVLRLYGNRSSTGAETASAAQSVYGASSDNWSETGITWNARPTAATSALAGVIGSGYAPHWYEWYVTAYVKSRIAANTPFVSLIVTMDMPPSGDEDYDTFASREAGTNAPQLLFVP